MKYCKHCHFDIEERGSQWIHIGGRGLRCQIEPYGFQAEPWDKPCNNDPINPCNGSLGITPDDTNWEHEFPDKWCRAPLCKNTNWGGYGRLHLRSSDCPPYHPIPARNEMAEFWEDVRQWARENGEKR